MTRLLAPFVAMGLVACLFASAAPAHAADGPARASMTTVQPRATTSYDGMLLKLINNARTARGLPALKTTKKLGKAAGKWSKKLAAKRKLSHDPNLRASVSSKSGCRYVRSWGENVAYTSGSAASMFSMYMNSPGHRANILDVGYTHVGVKTVNRKASWGKVHWNTMKFVTARCS